MKKKFVSLLSIILVIALFAVALIACQKYGDEETPEEDVESTPTYTHTVSNGTFYDAESSSSVTDSAILDTVSGWSAKSGATTSSNSEKTGTLNAAINIANEADFNAFAAKYLTLNAGEENAKTIKYPGIDSKTPTVKVADGNGNYTDEREDTNVYAIANTKSTGSLYAEKSAFTLEKQSYYLLQFSVYTMIDAAEGDTTKGAWFMLLNGSTSTTTDPNGAVSYTVASINTHETWQTYYLFIETSKNYEMSLKAQIWLGYGPEVYTATSDTDEKYVTDEKDKYATKGVVLFDNVLCEKVELKDIPATLATLKDSDGNVLAKCEGYEATEDLAPNNFASFKSKLSDVKKDSAKNKYVAAKSAYYLSNADMKLRTPLSSFGADARIYFYSFREKNGVTNLQYYTLSSSAGTYDSKYYGHVDVSNLYTIPTGDAAKPEKDNYTGNEGISSTLFTAMSYDDWYNNVMNGAEHNLSTAEETFALMIYNKDLAANALKTAEKITIEANQYYEISVWAYVWANKNKDGKYYEAYSQSDPADKSLNIGADVEKLYNLIKDGKLDNVFVDAENIAIEYSTALTKTEKDKAADYNDALSKVPDEYRIDGTFEGTYKDEDGNTLKSKVITWLKGATMLNDTTLKDTDVNGLVDYLYYTYLYTHDDVLTPALTALKADGTLYKLSIYERQTNLKSYNDTKEKYEKQEKEHQDWVVAKAEYEQKYTRWEENNMVDGEVLPRATVKLTGSGEIKDQQTTALNEWQQLTFYVKGSQLSQRQVTLEMCLGTGTDSSTYMLGGVFFDNIEIKESKNLPEGKTEADFTVISEIKGTTQIDYGTLSVESRDEIIENDWNVIMATGTATSDEAQVERTFDETGKTITLGNKTYKAYAVSLNNKIPTASTLNYTGNKAVKILPNKFYRFAFLVKTEGVDESLGATIELLSGESEDAVTVSQGTITSFVSKKNSEGMPDWSEVVFYIQGDLSKTYYVGVQVSLGSGTKYTTDSYVKGTISLAAFNCLEIEYSEYKDKATGDETKSVSLYNISTALDGESIKFDNPYYSSIDYSKTDDDQFDKETGALTGVGTTEDWTVSTTGNKYDAPTEVKLDANTGKLSWKAASGVVDNGSGVAVNEDATKYEIWMKYTIDNKTYEKFYNSVNAVPGQEDYSVDLNWAGKVATYFAVKAIGEHGTSEPSSYTSAYLQGTEDELVAPEAVDGAVKTEAQAGTINKTEELFGNDSIKDYTSSSTYPTILKLDAPYETILKMQSDKLSTGLSENSYYKISVWAKTEPGTEMSIILGGTSGSLNADNELGFVMVDTDGKWQEFSFYIKTGNFAAKMYIQYSIGNPYAVAKTHNVNDKSGTFYLNSDLSSGTAYFDVVRVSTITEAQYDDAAEKATKNGEDKYPSLAQEIVYTNSRNYVYTMEYVMDSFDSTTVPTSDTDKKGNTPSNYSRKYDSDLTDSTNLATYGVYDRNSEDEKMQQAIKYLYTHTDDDKNTVLSFNEIFKKAYEAEIAANDKVESPYDWNTLSNEDWKGIIESFLKISREEEGTTTDGGDNVLVLSNKVESGYAQHFDLSSTYSYTVKAKTYAKLTFSARTLIAKVTKSETTADDGTTTAVYNYSLSDAFAELRVNPTSSSETTTSVKISSFVYGDSLFDDVTYTLYFYNPTDDDNTVTWSFYLGDEELSADEKEENKNPGEIHDYLVGMLAVDLVSCEESASWTPNAFASAKTAADSDKKSTIEYYQYEVKKTDSKSTETDTKDDEDDAEEESTWDKIVGNEYFWLYISSFVIALVILITVIVVLIRKWRKKHPKEVVVENVAKTEKDIKVIPTEPQIKEEALEADEYVDEIKPQYVQRVNKNKSRKDRKNGKK